MDMRILIEPDYQNSYWCTETIKGIREQAYLRKINLISLDEQAIMQSLPDNGKNVIIVVGTSINWINRITSSILYKGFLCLLVTSDQKFYLANDASSILMDYRNSMYTLLSYLEEIGDQHIAFFGANPNSYADMVKCSCFSWKKDIYYNFGSVTTCTNQIWSRIRNYDAIICANDAVAIHLLHFLLEHGISIPQDLHLVSFGDFFLSQFIQPSITSVAQDYRMLGQQAVNTCSFLSKNPQLTVNVLIKCTLKIRESTDKKETSPTPSYLNNQENESADVNFYSDTPIALILSLEKLLMSSDYLDLQILQLLLHKTTQEKIAEELNFSLSSLRYRIRKLCSCFPDYSRDAMLDTIRSYLPSNALENAIKQKKYLDF